MFTNELEIPVAIPNVTAIVEDMAIKTTKTEFTSFFIITAPLLF
jgi:hypothetical protein